MYQKRYAEIGIGIFCILWGIVYWMLAPESMDMGYGVPPQIYEHLLSGFLIFCGLLELFTVLKKSSSLPQRKKIFWGKALSVLLISILYIALFDFLGFIVSSVLAAMGVILALGERKPVLVIGVPLLCSLIIYFIFSEVMGVLLPKGILVF